MPFDIFTTAQDETRRFMAARPIVDAREVTAGEAWLPAWFALSSTWEGLTVQKNALQVVNDWLDDFEGAAGYRPDAFRSALMAGYFDYDTINKAYETERTSRPEFDLRPPPSREEARAIAIQMQRDIHRTRELLAQRPQTFGSVAVGILAPTVALATDPINLASMAYLTPWSLGRVAFALREAAIVGGAQAAISTTQFPLRQQIDPTHDLGDVVGEIAFAAGAGAVFGIGLKAIAAAPVGRRFAGDLATFAATMRDGR